MLCQCLCHARVRRTTPAYPLPCLPSQHWLDASSAFYLACRCPQVGACLPAPPPPCPVQADGTAPATYRLLSPRPLDGYTTFRALGNPTGRFLPYFVAYQAATPHARMAASRLPGSRRTSGGTPDRSTCLGLVYSTLYLRCGDGCYRLRVLGSLNLFRSCRCVAAARGETQTLRARTTYNGGRPRAHSLATVDARGIHTYACWTFADSV